MKTQEQDIEVKQDYVVFYSPGTFVSEETSKEVDSWDVDAAAEMAKSIKERHGAVPYGFRFNTRGREEGEMDSRVIAKSPFYFLGGTVKTLEQVEAENNPDNHILISNMKCNGYDMVIANNN